MNAILERRLQYLHLEGCIAIPFYSMEDAGHVLAYRLKQNLFNFNFLK